MVRVAFVAVPVAPTASFVVTFLVRVFFRRHSTWRCLFSSHPGIISVRTNDRLALASSYTVLVSDAVGQIFFGKAVAEPSVFPHSNTASPADSIASSLAHWDTGCFLSFTTLHR